MNHSPLRRGLVFIALVLACFALSPDVRAACQQGCDLTNGNTFFGDDALDCAARVEDSNLTRAKARAGRRVD